MAKTPDRLFIRRQTLAALLLGLASPTAFGAPGRPKVVTILGDSITAGLGLSEADALPRQLQLALARLGAAAQVRGAGVSGDTTAEGLARADFSVQGDTRLCIVALGGNDLLQGLDPGSMRANLQAIVRRLKARRIGVLLIGLEPPPAIGAGYVRDFQAAFADVARGEHVALYPDLLAGIDNNPAYRQRDGVHPNAAGVRIIAAHLAPAVARLLKAAR